MARRQTRRTISISRALIERVRAHAAQHDVAMSALTEFALERMLGERFNDAAFDAWYAARYERVVALQKAASAAASAARIPWATRQGGAS